MGLLLLDSAVTARRGLVRASGQLLFDDNGVFHPLGLTFFWALYGWKFERQRVLDHLRWMQRYGFDYLRILCEVDWEGRTIDPNWTDYQSVIAEFVDAAYAHGMRTELTLVGGKSANGLDIAQKVTAAMQGREHKVLHYEVANEWDRLDKATLPELVDVGRYLVTHTPNLVALSRPKQKSDEHDDSGYEAMRVATEKAGADSFTLHPRRSTADSGWAHVRQGYDFKDFHGATFNNEPEGPQSSVVSMENPLQLAMSRALGVMCGGAGYVLHAGAGVFGIPISGRPADLWDVDDIDNIIRAVRGVDKLVPDGVENWKVVNNARDDHPLPLPKSGFWEGSDAGPAVNKNYAAIHGADFMVALTGVKSRGVSGMVLAGVPIKRCHVEAFDPATQERVTLADLARGEPWYLPGRGDSMCGYLVRGHYR